ncbi:substrate-binding domain-containing protein [Labrys wisconsinensis]|uniref:Ribose transport system substrate-binding protein n=1 Tax=Labrys wisconsinensis TaxID=425677 RepID=A0ABU0J5Z9_9HYPH|nr:substrate-binding domain-containing protein [Labrys wisconsinensis]MDQ0468632.1 ribose transport system substrate-binding protein [Labrys wisconsinensis]
MTFTRRNVLTVIAGAAGASIAGVEMPASAAEKIKIGFSQCTLNHPWRVAQTNVNKAYADDKLSDVSLIITDGNNDSGKQVSDIENLMAQGVKVLMISPLTADALTPIVRQAMESGIPVVTLDRKVNTKVTCHIGALNLPIAAAAAALLARKLDGKGAIIELQGTAGASATVDRNKGFVDELAKTPGLKIVASQNCDYTRDKAVKFMEDMVQRFGEGQIQAVYAHNDEMALGAVQVLEGAGRLKDVLVIGIDGQNNAIEAVAAGKLAATFTYPYVAPEGIQYAHKIASGESVPEVVLLDSVAITADNAKSMIGKGF